MTIETSQPPSSHNDQIATQEEQNSTDLYDTHTPDSYDPHIVPAETAARKDREDGNFKHLDKHPDGSENLNTVSGFTIDKEGLIDNFCIEPEMYYETPGDISDQEISTSDQLKESEDI